MVAFEVRPNLIDVRMALLDTWRRRFVRGRCEFDFCVAWYVIGVDDDRLLGMMMVIAVFIQRRGRGGVCVGVQHTITICLLIDIFGVERFFKAFV